MQLPPLATNTTNTNCWILPSLLRMVYIPPSPPSRSGSFASWRWLSVCLSCLLAFSVCLFVSKFTPGSVLVFCKNVHVNAFNINSHPNSSLEQSLERHQKTYDPQNNNILSVKSSTENAGQTDRLSMGSLFSACPGHCLHSLSDNYLHILHMHM